MTAYRNPPILERAFSVGMSVDEETFQRHLETWKDVVRSELPEYEAATQWRVQIVTRDGFPVMEREPDAITINHRFWHGKQPTRDKGVMLRKDRLAFNLIGNPPGNPRSYQELKAFSDYWLDKCSNHFALRSFTGVTLEYVNILSTRTVPQFSEGQKMRISNILTAFRVPGENVNLVPPFSFELNMGNQPAPVRLFHAKLTTIPSPLPGAPTLRLLFKATTEVPRKDIPLSAVKQECDDVHGLILQKFQDFFTKEALESFGPL